MPRTERRFVYRERTKEDLRERANMRGGNFDDFVKSSYKKYKVRDGKNIIRILPPTWEGLPNHYGYDIYLNYEIGPDNNSYLSLSKMKKERDPIAEACQQASREGDEKLANSLRPRQRILMWVIDRQAEDEGPQLWPAPFTFDKDLASISFDEDTGEITYIDDPEEGCDVRFYKEGSGLNTKYPAAKMKLMQPGPIHQDERKQDEWLNYIQENPVPDCLNYYDYDYLSAVFSGGAPKRDEEDEKPTRRRTQEQSRVQARGQAPWDEDDGPQQNTPATKPNQPKPNGRQVDPEDDEPPPSPRRQRRPHVTEPEPETEAPPDPPAGSIRARIARRRAEVLGEED